MGFPNLLKNKFTKNVSWVLIGNVLHAVFQFLLNIRAARILTEHDYGLMNYAVSIVALFTSIGTFGFSGVITKKFAENENEAGKYICSAVVSRMAFAIPLIAVIIIIGYIHAPTDRLLHAILLCHGLHVLYASGDLFVYWFRYKYKANLVAVVRLIAFIIMAIWRVLALLVFKSVLFYVIGTTLETAVFVLILLFIYLKESQPRLRIDFNAFKSMLRISYPFIFSALLATIYGQTDKIMLESMVSTESVAVYSVSLTLAGAISIIPTAIIEGFRPEILRYKEIDTYKYKKRMRQLYFMVFWLCIAYCVFITVLARPIILILYGEKYIESVKSLSLIVWYTSFSFFGGINNIYMVAESKTKWVQITTFVGAAFNIALNFLLIPFMGVVGAALASLITQIIANFAIVYIIKPLRPCFYLQIQGIVNKDCFNLSRKK